MKWQVADLNRIAARLRLEADFLDQLAVEMVEEPDADPDLGLKEIWDRHHIGREAILGAEARGELRLTRKTGRKTIYVRQSVLDAWVTSGQSVHRSMDDDDGDAERERQLKAWTAERRSS